MKDVEAATGINETSIGLYETAKRLPSIDKICLLANFFDVSLEEIVEDMHSRQMKEDAAVFEYRVKRAMSLAMSARLIPVILDDGKVEITVPTIGADGKISTTLQTIIFSNTDDFADFIESTEDTAIDKNVPFIIVASAMTPIFVGK